MPKRPQKRKKTDRFEDSEEYESGMSMIISMSIAYVFAKTDKMMNQVELAEFIELHLHDLLGSPEESTPDTHELSPILNAIKIAYQNSLR